MVTAVPFPTTSAPGRRPGEGTGELVNCFAQKNVDELEWLRVPGLKPAYTVPDVAVPRGMMGNSNLLVHGWEDMIAVTDAGGTRRMAGLIAGTDAITFARNNRQPTPDIVAVAQAGAYRVDIANDTITAYSAAEPDVGAPNSVSYFNGYFLFTYGNGRIVASGIQSTTIDANAYAYAEANPDGLYRGVTVGSFWLAMGPLTLEVWQDTGQLILPDGAVSPFPLTRSTVIPVGLIGPWAVAGTSDEWDRPLLFVASDYTVRMLDGYAPKIVSTADVAADIFAQRANPNEFVASVHVHNDNAFWTLSCPAWTWEFNLTTTNWHKRASYLEPRWRIGFTAQAFERWLGQDRNSAAIHEIISDAQDEAGAPLIARGRSGPVKEFPTNVRVPRAVFDFTVGLGSVIGTDTIGVETSGTNPTVMLSWSHDGGASWANPLRRSLGRQGEYSTLVQVNNLGRSTHHGVRLEWTIIDPVSFKFRGAVLPGIQPRRPAQVGGASAIAVPP